MSPSTNIRTECLLNNIIDEDFHAVLRPLGIFDSIFLLSKFSIINSFITPNNKAYFIKSFFSLLILTCMSCYRFYLYRGVLIFTNSINILCILWFDFIYINATLVMIYITSAQQSENVVLLIIKVQNALHVININGTHSLFKVKFFNWLHVIAIVAMYVIYAFAILVATRNLSSGIFFFSIPFLIFDLNIIYASRTLHLISKSLVMWNYKMKQYEKEDDGGFQETAENLKTHGEHMFIAYKDLMSAFYLTGKVYQFAISYHMLATFVYFLSFVQTFIEYGELKNAEVLVHPVLRAVGFLTNVKNVALLANVCNAAGKIYKNVTIAEVLCAKILGKHISDLRKPCKNVLRYNRGALRPLRALGACVDAALPLRLLATVLVYTVVLLQFAFL